MQSAMTFAPPGVTTGPDDFGGKLLVMVAPDQTAASGAHSVRVGAAEGTLSTEDGTSILIFMPDSGRQVVVQAPATLGWDEVTLVRFAESIAIGADAKRSVG